MNMSFVEKLARMPNCANFLKETIGNKKNLNTSGTLSLLEKYSVLI